MKMKYMLLRRKENSLFGPIIKEGWPEDEWPDKCQLLGPNTLGKSAMLYIIGIGCDGINNEKIDSSVIEKMKHFMDEKYHQLTFRIEFESADGTLRLILEKSDNNPKIKITQILNGEPPKELSIEDFRRYYVLIYDTPIDIVKRVKGLKNEFGDIQLDIHRGILRYKAYLKQIMTDADNKRIDKINEKIDELSMKEKRIRDLQRQIELSQARLQSLECATYFHYQDYYKSQKDNVEKDREKLKQDIESLGGNIKATDNKLGKAHRDVSNKISILRTNYDSISIQLEHLMPDDTYNLDIWEKIDIDKMKNGNIIDNEFKRLIIHFMSAIDMMKKDNKESREELKACKELEALCGRYRELDMRILGTALSFADGFQWASQELDKRKKIRASIDSMENCSQKLGAMKIDLEELEKLLHRIDTMDKEILTKKEHSYEIESKREELSKYERLLSQCNDKYLKYSSLIVTNKVNYDKNCKIGEGELAEYKGRSEDGLMGVIDQFKANNSDNMHMLDDENERRNKMKLDLQKLKDMPEVPYEKHMKELEKFFKATESLQVVFGQKFKNYINDIDEYRDKKFDMANLSEEQKIYYNSLFLYLAKVMRKIRHMNKDVEVIEINLIRNTFTSKDGIERNFLDLGGGENRLNSLISILEPKDNRKMIILLDEMGDIDPKNTDIIKERLRNLRDEGRLLFGIIVQANPFLEIYEI